MNSKNAREYIALLNVFKLLKINDEDFDNTDFAYELFKRLNKAKGKKIKQLEDYDEDIEFETRLCMLPDGTKFQFDTNWDLELRINVDSRDPYYLSYKDIVKLKPKLVWFTDLEIDKRRTGKGPNDIKAKVVSKEMRDCKCLELDAPMSLVKLALMKCKIDVTSSQDCLISDSNGRKVVAMPYKGKTLLMYGEE